MPSFHNHFRRLDEDKLRPYKIRRHKTLSIYRSISLSSFFDLQEFWHVALWVDDNLKRSNFNTGEYKTHNVSLIIDDS